LGGVSSLYVFQLFSLFNLAFWPAFDRSNQCTRG